MISETAQASKNQQPGRVECGAVRSGEWVQMEGAVQRIRRLECNYVRVNRWAKNGVLQAAFLRLQQLGIIQIVFAGPCTPICGDCLRRASRGQIW